MADSLVSVDRALRLLLLFHEPQQGLRVNEIAQLLNVHKSTASRLCAKLASMNFLERDDDDIYRLGVSLARLGTQVSITRSLIVASGRVLGALANNTGETVNISQLDGDRPLTLAQREGEYAANEENWIGKRDQAHASATGKVFFAFNRDAELPRSYPRLASRTLTSSKLFEAELATVRGRRYATSVSELREHLNAVAVPIFDTSNNCVGALDVSGSDARLDARRLVFLGTGPLLAGARVIERELAQRMRDAVPDPIERTSPVGLEHLALR